MGIPVKMTVYSRQSDCSWTLGPDQESIDRVREAGLDVFDPNAVRYIMPHQSESGEFEVEKRVPRPVPIGL